MEMKNAIKGITKRMRENKTKNCNKTAATKGTELHYS